MALKRFGNQRDSNEKEIVDALEKAGCSVVRLDTPVDLLVGRNWNTFLLEVKAPNGRFTNDQKEFVETWRGHLTIVRSIDEALRAVGVK